MSELEDWLDDECRLYTIGLSMTPENPSPATQEMVAEFREGMRHTFHGEALALRDAWHELARALKDALHL